MARIDKPIKNFLLDFGLTEKEIIIYLSLLKTGPNTIMNLSRETGIKRSTTHNTVEELIKKGLVSQTNYGERRMVVAEDPKKLEFLMEQKRWEMKKLEDNLPDIVSSIYNAVPKAKENTQMNVKYYTGEKGIRLIYTEALQAKELRSYANLEKIFSVFPDNSDLFTNAHKTNRDLRLWEIVEDSESARKYAEKFSDKERYQYKFTPTSIELNAIDVLIFDGKVATVNIAGDTMIGFIIENHDYYLNSKAIFDFVWKMLG